MVGRALQPGFEQSAYKTGAGLTARRGPPTARQMVTERGWWERLAIGAGSSYDDDASAGWTARDGDSQTSVDRMGVS